MTAGGPARDPARGPARDPAPADPARDPAPASLGRMAAAAVTLVAVAAVLAWRGQLPWWLLILVAVPVLVAAATTVTVLRRARPRWGPRNEEANQTGGGQ